MDNKYSSISTIKITTFKLYAALLLSSLYSLILGSLSNELFRDRVNYIYYAQYLESRLSSYSQYELLANEPLFYLYNYILRLFFEVNFIPKVTVFIISFTISFLIIYKSRNILSAILGILLLLFVPFTFHLQLVVLRQGLATAILLWNVFINWNNKKTFYFVCLLLCFVHISFGILFSVLLTDYILSKFVKSIKTRFLIIGITLFLLSSMILTIGNNLGVRQAYSDQLLINTNGGGGFILFSFILIFFMLRGLNNVIQNRYGYLACLGLVIYLAFYFTIPISGRIIGTFLPFIYIYTVSSNSLKVYFAATVFLVINIYLFHDSINNNSLSSFGNSVFSSLKSFINYIYLS